MHYYIDGYNMLFRMRSQRKALQHQRQSIVYELNQKIDVIKLDVAIIFDATYQEGEHSRYHFDKLEIHFTEKGQTADEYILNELRTCFHPQKETVVTSDKLLARLSRQEFAQTQSVEDFVSWLNRSYKNKIHRNKLLTPESSLLKSCLTTALPTVCSNEKPLKGSYNYYLHFFEAEHAEILEIEKKREAFKTAGHNSKHPKKKNLPKLNSAFDSPPIVYTGRTEMERWLNAFETRLMNPKE